MGGGWGGGGGKFAREIALGGDCRFARYDNRLDVSAPRMRPAAPAPRPAALVFNSWWCVRARARPFVRAGVCASVRVRVCLRARRGPPPRRPCLQLVVVRARVGEPVCVRGCVCVCVCACVFEGAPRPAALVFNS